MHVQNPIEQESVLSGCLRELRMAPEQFERLVAAIYDADGRGRTMRGAPGGGVDNGIDMLRYRASASLEVWSITTTEKRRLKSKFEDDIRKIAASIAITDLPALETIYVCSRERINNKLLFQLNEYASNLLRDYYRSRGAVAPAGGLVVKCDSDSIAAELCRSSALQSYKREIQDRICRGFGLPSLESFDVEIDPEDTEAIPRISAGYDYIAEAQQPWTVLHRQLLDLKVVLDDSDDPPNAVLQLCVELLSSTAASTPRDREQRLPELLRSLNKRTWPSLFEAWNEHRPLRAAASVAPVFVYAQVLLGNQSNRLSANELQRATDWLLSTPLAALGRRHGVYALVSALAWLNYRQSRVDVLEEVAKYALDLLKAKMGENRSVEERILLFSLARLYLTVLRFRVGGLNAAKYLRGFYEQYMECESDEFWRSAFAMQYELYGDSLAWNARYPAFIRSFEELKLSDVQTVSRALTYLHLQSAYARLVVGGRYEAVSLSLEVIQKLPPTIRNDYRIRIREFSFETQALRSAERHRVFLHLKRCEKLVRELASVLSDTYGMLHRFEFFNAFVAQAPNCFLSRENELGKEAEGSILAELLNRDSPALDFRVFFGFSLPSEEQAARAHQIPAERRLRALVSSGLNAVLRLDSSALPDDVLGRIAFNYVELLNFAATRYGQRYRIQFELLVDALEEKSCRSPSIDLFLASIFRRPIWRNLEKAKHYYSLFWKSASDFQKASFCAPYLKTLYESYQYVEELEQKETVLDALLDAGERFQDFGINRHLVNCYLGLGHALRGDERAQPEIAFLEMLGMRVLQLGVGSPRRVVSSAGSVVYTERFREVLGEWESRSLVAASLLSALNSPEVYNDIATFLLNRARAEQDLSRIASVAALYDVALGLAQGSEFFEPKFRYNRLMCDFWELQMRAEIRGDEDERLVAIVMGLLAIQRQFLWARKALEGPIADFLAAKVNAPEYEQTKFSLRTSPRWKTVDRAVSKRLERVVIS